MIAENELKARVLKLEGELEVREAIIVCTSALNLFPSSVYKYSLKRITGLIPCVLLSVKTIVVLHITFPLICLLLCNKWDVIELHNSPVSEIYTDGEFWVLSFIQICLASCPDDPARDWREWHTFPPGWDSPTGESAGAQRERGDPAGEGNGQGEESQWGGRHFPRIGYKRGAETLKYFFYQ